MRIIDLFSGAGGLTFGFYYRIRDKKFIRNRQNVFVFANEVNVAAANAFKMNYPDIDMYQCDIRDLKEKDIIKRIGNESVDIIIGGPPCQSYSTVGLRNYNENAKLYEEYFRILNIVQPKMFLFENVRGLLSMREIFYKTDKKGNVLYRLTHISGKESLRPRKRPVISHYGDFVFNKIKKLFENEKGTFGYNIQYKILNAADYGVPENRERVFIVGVRKDLNIKWKFPLKTNLTKLSVKDAINDLPHVGENCLISKYDKKPQNDYQILMRGNANNITQHFCGSYGDKIRVVIENIKQGQGRNDFNKLVDIGKINKKYRLTSGYANTYGRLVENEPCTTITNNLTSPSGLRCIHYSENRALTPREGARIQSFPDWFNFYGNKSEVTSQIGNAVPPLLAICLANQFEKSLKTYNYKM